MEQLNESRINEIIENFNKDFESKIKTNKAKFLINLYNNFITLLGTESTIDRESLERLDKIEKEVDSTFSEKQKVLFAKWTNAHEQLISDIADQAFVYGYCTCKILDDESSLKGSANNE